MGVLKCKMCGAPIETTDNNHLVTCGYCGSKQTIIDTNDEKKTNLFNRANQLRMNCDFDGAIAAYESIIGTYHQEPEAYWGLALSKFGIEYVDDPKTKKKIPTIHRSSFELFNKDSNFIRAVEYADIIAKEEYKNEATEITNIQKSILSISQKEKPFDIFICYKESDFEGKRTKDSVIAQELHQILTDKGYKVFFSRVTLENKLGTMYEPYIFAALNSAKIMIVVGSCKEYFNATWVKNEWSRFLSLMAGKSDKYIIPCYRDMNAYEMPEELLGFQAQDLGKLGFIQDLVRGINKLLGKEENKPTSRVVHTDVNIEALLQRAEILLQDKEYEKADDLLEKVLNNDPKNSDAYLLKSVISNNVSSIDELKLQDKEIIDTNFKRALAYADDERKTFLLSINETIENRNKERQYTAIYNDATNNKNLGNFDRAIELFNSISGFKDSNVLAANCVKAKNEKIYQKAITDKNNQQYSSAISLLKTIIDYKDSKDVIEDIELIIKENDYQTAKKYLYAKEFEAAKLIFQKLGNYKDSAEILANFSVITNEIETENKYQSALIQGEINPERDFRKLEKSIKILASIRSYKDASTLLSLYEGYFAEGKRIIDQKLEEKKRKDAIKRRKVRNISLIISSIIVVITALLVSTFTYFIPESNQNKIIDLINAGQYDEAESFLNSQDSSFESYGKVNQLNYLINAGQAFKNGDYESAISFVKSAGGETTVNYDADGGEAASSSRVFKKNINNDPTKPGYDFKQWYLTDFTLDATTFTATANLKASYDIITYNISYNFSGGKAIDQNAPFYSAYTVEDEFIIPNLYKKGYTFLGWSKYSTETPKIDYVFEKGTIGNINFVAHFEANTYKISFEGAEDVTTTLSVKYDSYFNLPKSTKKGYTFLGWHDENGQKVEDGYYLWDHDITLTAKYNINKYTITYNLKGGTNNSSNPTSFTINDKITLKDPSLEGNTFLGWTITGESSTPKKNLVIENRASNITVNANWEANDYVVSIDYDDGKTDVFTKTFTYGKSYSITEPTKQGYDFVKFVDQNNKTVASSGTWKYVDVTSIKAIWTESLNTPYKINYYFESLDGDYDLVLSKSLTGKTNSYVNKQYDEYLTSIADYDEFHFVGEKEIVSSQILADGSMCIDFYFDRNVYEVEFFPNNGESSFTNQYKFGEKINETVNRDEDIFIGWYKTDITDPEGSIYDVEFVEVIDSNTTQLYAGFEGELSLESFSYIKKASTIAINFVLEDEGFITIPKYVENLPVTEILDACFKDLTYLQGVTLPDTITYIGESAFKDCSSLETVSGCSDISRIEKNTFYGCESLTNIDIDFNSLTYIGENAFRYTNIETLNLKSTNNIEYIGEYAFYWCESLTELPDLSNVLFIGDYAFANCGALINANNLNSSAEIGEAIFANTTLHKITFILGENIEQLYVEKFFISASNSYLFNINEELFYKTENDIYVSKYLTDIEIKDPNNIGIIPDNFARNISSLVNFSYEGTVKTVGENAFSNCSDLTTVTMTTVDAIEYKSHAFYNCSNLTSTFAFKNGSIIGESAFENCNNAVFSNDFNGVTISSHAFRNVLTFEEIKNFTPNLEAVGAFEGSAYISSVDVDLKANSYLDGFKLYEILFGTTRPENLSSQFYKEEGYYIPTLFKTLTISSENDYIPDYLAYNLESLTKVEVLSENIVIVGEKSFANCSNLTDVTLSSLTTTINDYAFLNCSSLETYPGNKHTTYIGKNAFESNNILELPDLSNITIKSEAFAFNYNLKEIKNIYISGIEQKGIFFACESIESISVIVDSDLEEFAFASLFGAYDDGTNSNFYKATNNIGVSYCFPHAVTSVTGTFYNVPAYFFNGLTSLTEVINRNEEVDYVGNNAFDNCINLETITGFYTNYYGDYAFRNCINLTSSFDLTYVEYVGHSAFKGCSQIDTEFCFESIKHIGEYAFYGVKGPTEFRCENEELLTYIGSYAFIDTDVIGVYSLNIDSVDAANAVSIFDNDVVELSLYQFKDTTSSSYQFSLYNMFAAYENNGEIQVGMIEFISKYGVIPAYFAKDLVHLESFFDYSDEINKIGDYAFMNTSYLLNFDIDNPVLEYIGDHAFDNSGIEEIPSLDNVVYIGSYAFYKSKITSFDLSSNEVLTEINACSFSGLTKLTSWNNKTDGSFELPDNVTSIGSSAFSNNPYFVDVKLSTNIRYLNLCVFYGCPNIRKLELPFSGPNINSRTFLSSLINKTTPVKELIVHGGYVVEDALSGFNTITDLYIGDAVTSIGNAPLAGCSSLENIRLPYLGTKIDTPIKLGELFGTTSNSNMVAVSQNSITYYLPTNLSKVEICGGSISDYALQNISTIDELIIGEGVTSIGNFSFENLSLINELVVPETVESIGNGAFKGCNAIKNITLPFVGQSESATEYNAVFGYIFGYSNPYSSTVSYTDYNYKTSDSTSKYTTQYPVGSTTGRVIVYYYEIPESIENVTITKQVNIPSCAFQNCDLIKTITIPDTVESVGSHAFYECSAEIKETYKPTSSSIWDGTVATSYHDGVGTKENPYIIFTASEFAYFADQVNSGNSYENSYFKLTSNIRFANKEFYTIGTLENPFSGNFDGCGYVIKDFIINGSGIYTGLFGYINGTIENVGIINAVITSTTTANGTYYAAPIAYLSENGIIKNVYSTGIITNNAVYYSYAGGLVGYSKGLIENSYSTCNVVANSTSLFAYAGGLAGYLEGTIKYCFAAGNVTANGANDSYSKNGALVGDKSSSSSIIESYRTDTQQLIKFNVSNSCYNEDGKINSIKEITKLLSKCWDSNWNFNKSLPILNPNI